MNILKKINLIKKILDVIEMVKISNNGDVYIKTCGSVVLDTEHIIVGSSGHIVLSPEQKIYLAPSNVRDVLEELKGGDVNTLLKTSIKGAEQAELNAKEALFSKACTSLHESNNKGCTHE